MIRNLVLTMFSIPTSASVTEELHRKTKATRRKFKSAELSESSMEKLVFVQRRFTAE